MSARPRFLVRAMQRGIDMSRPSPSAGLATQYHSPSDAMSGSNGAPPSYDFKDWMTDVAWFFSEQTRLSESGAKGFPAMLIPDYFEVKYGPSALFHQYRLVAAMRFLEVHVKEFDTGKIAIVGEEQAAIGRSLLISLFALYSRCPDQHVGDEFSVDFVLREAKKIEQQLQQ